MTLTEWDVSVNQVEVLWGVITREVSDLQDGGGNAWPRVWSDPGFVRRGEYAAAL